MKSFASWLVSPGNHILGSIPSAAVGLLIITLLLSALGFARTVYFISVGYGLSVAGASFFSFVFFRSSGNVAALLHMLLIVVYGFRLAGYLTMRERKRSYQTVKGEVETTYGTVAPALRLAIWIGVSILYVLMASPVLFHFSTLYGIAHGSIEPPTESIALALVLVGLAACAAGLLIEWRADAQKARWKRTNPSRFCSSGLYRMVRFPNYFGEIVLWTGSWIAGVPFYQGPAQWAASLAGLTAIVLIMLGSAKRLEAAQERRYGSDSDFRAYAHSVPILFPGVPLYSLKRLKIYLG
ncbi:DUF1295 domain-containing protein [Salinispira pacifica]